MSSDKLPWKTNSTGGWRREPSGKPVSIVRTFTFLHLPQSDALWSQESYFIENTWPIFSLLVKVVVIVYLLQYLPMEINSFLSLEDLTSVDGRRPVTTAVASDIMGFLTFYFTGSVHICVWTTARKTDRLCHCFFHETAPQQDDISLEELTDSFCAPAAHQCQFKPSHSAAASQGPTETRGQLGKCVCWLMLGFYIQRIYLFIFISVI